MHDGSVPNRWCLCLHCDAVGHGIVERAGVEDGEPATEELHNNPRFSPLTLMVHEVEWDSKSAERKFVGVGVPSRYDYGHQISDISQQPEGTTVGSLDRVKGMTTQIAGVDADLDQAVAELDMLRHLEDDAARDALVSEGWDDRVDAKNAKRDVDRCVKRIKRLEMDREKLVTRRSAMIDRLAAQ